MKSYPTLPQGYVPFATIDLVHNKNSFGSSTDFPLPCV